ncbi:transporter substrate-binding domain-containing protein [Rhodococcus qingshengii]|uniref:transporter substrate-binding domain-containing protein n=1 Tax=Rhodococcus qingshengii TaxID=334542 RepID=UPI0036DD71FF
MPKYRQHSIVVLLSTIAFIAVFASGCGGGGSGLVKTSTMDSVLASGKLRVAYLSNYPPYGTLSTDGSPQGYDVDIARKLADSMGVEVEFVSATNADRVPLLQTNKVDAVIGSFTQTLERAQVVSFSDPYNVAGQVLAVRPGSTIKEVGDLAGKTIAVTKGGTAGPSLQKAVPDAVLQSYDSPEQTLLALNSGKSDAAVEDSNFLAYQVSKGGSLVIPSSESLVPLEYNAIGVKLGDPVWLTYVNQFVFKLNSTGENKSLYRQWFGFDSPYPLSPDY